MPLTASRSEDMRGSARWFAAQKPRLQAYVRRQLRDWSEVDDIVQETFLELVTGLSPPDGAHRAPGRMADARGAQPNHRSLSAAVPR